MFVCELERAHQPQSLVHGAAHGQVVHRHVAQDALPVD
ncbi:unnamed protein product [Plutella xylostella]|uniref:(diamondback moth) hypothetical protein n=1 Tax=Plutella xylostella TaxID=51655 RepID=A0A8S4GF55_PLUXY|nr:unnamed protein product [Plutella xylostella]